MYFTSESVTKGHPDKICDQIADRILEECLRKDPKSRVACEVCCTTGTVILMGEITTKAIINYKEIARDVLRSIGYTNEAYGISADTCSVMDLIDKQSPEIGAAVSTAVEVRCSTDAERFTLREIDKYDIQGAGDQGIMFGYACNETEELLPLSLVLSDNLARRLEYVRENGIVKGLRPDGKTQVTLHYDESGKITHIDTILISTQHDPGLSADYLYDELLRNVIIPTLDKMNVLHLFFVYSFCDGGAKTNVIINPSGSFTIGGPQGDTGLTGRKLAVDTYGGHAKFGGGALSGKCPSKVDRSGAYMARYMAKHIVASGLSDRCEVQVSYAIGKATPVSINIQVNPKDSYKLAFETEMVQYLNELFDFRPLAIIDKLELLETQYSKISHRSHFMDQTMPWERLDHTIVNSIKIASALDSNEPYSI